MSSDNEIKRRKRTRDFLKAVQADLFDDEVTRIALRAEEESEEIPTLQPQTNSIELPLQESFLSRCESTDLIDLPTVSDFCAEDEPMLASCNEFETFKESLPQDISLMVETVTNPQINEGVEAAEGDVPIYNNFSDSSYYDSDESDSGTKLEVGNSPDKSPPECVTSYDPQDISSDLIQWALKHGITHSALNDLLSILKKNGHTSLPKLASSLLKTPHDTSKNVVTLGSGQYWYHGILNCLKVHFKPSMASTNANGKIVEIDIFIDGISPYKSPSKNVQLWPIAGRILCSDLETKPFIIALWCGSSKEPNNLDEYLNPFVDEYESLMEGFELNGEVYKLAIRFCIADAPARAWLKRVNPHNSLVCCERCEIRCERINQTIVFSPVGSSTARTDDSFILKSDPEYHKGTSPFEKILKMLSQFPLERLHLVDLGAMKRILKMILEPKASAIRLMPAKMSKIDDLIDVLSPFLPSEFKRRPKGLKFWKTLKGKELRRFLHYDGILIMWLVEQMLSENQKGVWKCFLQLSCGVRILCDEKLCHEFNADAKLLLELFVKDSAYVFGPHFVVYNIHHLTHLADECLLHGPLDNYSAYLYESSLREMKKLLRAPGRALPQIVARTLERERNLPAEIVPKSKKVRLTLPDYVGPADGLVGEMYGIFEKDFVLKVDSINDCCCLTESGDVIIVMNIVRTHESIFFLLVKDLLKSRLFFC